MKKKLVAVSALIALGAALFAQTIVFQPYVDLEWEPVYYAKSMGEAEWNARAYNFNQSGMKITGNTDKLLVYFEIRGVPTGGTYHHLDSEWAQMSGGWASSAAYYARGEWKPFANSTIIAGKYKPMFGPILFDQSHFGAGWKQKITDGLSLSAFLVQPGAMNQTIFTGAVAGTPLLGLSGKKNSDGIDEGLRGLLLAESMSKTLMVTGGLAYDWMPHQTNDKVFNRITGNVFAAYMGISKLTLSGELGVVLNMGEKLVNSDPGTPKDDFGVGLGVYASAEYQITAPIAVGATVKWIGPDLGEKTLGSYTRAAAVAGSWNSAGTAWTPPKAADTEYYIQDTLRLGAYAKFTPARGFWIQPGVTVDLSNAAYGYTPTARDGSDGDKVGASFLLEFRWEPRFTLKQ